tara:strand:- start:2105 stop:2533 length:429 start_codon:yes stop_codon:yes gene_type:complete
MSPILAYTTEQFTDSEKKSKESMFQKIKNGLNKEYTLPVYGKGTLMEIIQFFVNLLIFPAIAYQMTKTWRRQEAADFNPWFVLLQFFGGAPEGMIGAIIGYLLGNTQMFIIGCYAMFYNAYMLYFRLFGKNGLMVGKKNKKK